MIAGLAEKAAAAQLRLARHYVDVMREVKQMQEQGGENETQALSRYDQERAQIERWWAWLSERADSDPDSADLLLLLSDGGLIPRLRMTANEQVAWYTRAVEVARQRGNIQALVRNLRDLAMGMFDQGNIPDSVVPIREACDLAARTGDQAAYAEGLLRLSHIYGDMGNLDDSIDCAERAFELFKTLGRARDMGAVLRQLGFITNRYGEWAKAERYLLEAYPLVLQYGNTRQLTDVLNVLALIAKGLGNYPEAMRLWTQAFEFAQKYGEPMSIAGMMMSLGAASDMLGDYARAKEYYLRALATARRYGIQRTEAAILGNLGFSAYLRGSYDEAAQYMEESLLPLRAQRQNLNLCVTMANLIPVYMALGKLDQARAALQEGFSLAQQIGAESIHAMMMVAAVQVWVGAAQLNDQNADRIALTEQAAYWSGLIMVCSNAEQENRDEIIKLRPHMEEILGAARVNELFTAGEQTTLDEVVSSVLNALA